MKEKEKKKDGGVEIRKKKTKKQKTKKKTNKQTNKRERKSKAWRGDKGEI